VGAQARSSSELASAPQEAAEWARQLGGEIDYVYRTLQRLGAQAVEVDDLLQEVFLVMCRRRAHYDRGRPLRPWIVGIVFRVMQESRRRRWREQPQGFVDAPDEAPPPEQQLAAAQERALVLSALGRLPAAQRLVLVMHELDELSMREIAQTLAVSQFTLYSRLKRAKLLFGKELRRAGVGAGLAGRAGAVAPASLLALEREPPPAPATARRRVVARLSAWLAQPPAEVPVPWPARPLAARTALTALMALAVLLSAAFALRGSWSRRAVAPAGAPPARGVALDRGLVGYWRFDEPAGSVVARDSSGGANDCLLHRLDPDQVWRDGLLAGALALTGRGWLQCPHVGAIDRLGDQLTIAAWVTRGTDLRNYRALVARQKGAGREDELLFGFSNGALLFASHSFRGRLTAPLPPALPPWFHVGVTRQPDGTTILFLDGVELARETTSGRRLGSAGSPLLIGGALNGPDPTRTHARFDGSIDELVIYDRALTGPEMAALAARQRPRAVR
jgi:RNA polymerase sigma-70 factor, ECF subfamily